MDAIIARASNLSLSDSLVVIAGCGLVSYLIFKRFEPQSPIALIGLLVVVPGLLTFLLRLHFSHTAAAFATSYLTYISVLSSSVVIYRTSPWHPLAKIPGPLLCKISKLWLVYKASRGKQYLYYKELHEKYGAYVRIGPNEVSIRDSDAVLPVLGATGLPKGPIWDGRGLPKPEDRSLISIRDPKEHAMRRRLWNKGFSTPALKDYEEIILKRGRQLLHALEQRQANFIDIATWMSYWSFDFMGDMAFGGGFELMRDGGDKEGVWETLENGLSRPLLTSHIPWAANYLLGLGSLKDARRLRAFAGSCATRRLKGGSLTKDLFFRLFEEDQSLKNYSFLRMTSESVLAIVAGSDTTATVMSNIWYYLVSNPIYFDRLHAEIDRVFPNGEEPIDTGKLADMPFLNAVINESMRLLPPVASGAQRSVLPGTGGRMVGSQFMPEGTNVFVHTYSLHRDPHYFSPVPEEFWPDRWLSADERVYPPTIFGTGDFGSKEKQPEVILNPAAFIPFSFGPAVCVGKNLALQEMSMMVALIAQKFDMKVAPGWNTKEWEAHIEDWFVLKLGSLPVVLKARI